MVVVVVVGYGMRHATRASLASLSFESSRLQLLESLPPAQQQGAGSLVPIADCSDSKMYSLIAAYESSQKCNDHFQHGVTR